MSQHLAQILPNRMANPLSIIIAATASQAEPLLEAMRQGGFETRWERVDSPAALGQALAQPGWEVLLAADPLPALNLEQLLSLAGAAAPELPVLVATSAADAAHTRAALECGAADVIWPAHIDRLPQAVERALLAAQRRAGAPGARVDQPVRNDPTEHHLHQRELDLVNMFATTLRAASTRAAMLPVMVEQLRLLAGAAAVALILRETAGSEWVVAAGLGWPDPDGTPLRPEDLASQVMAAGLAEWRVVGPHGGAAASAAYWLAATPLLVHGQAIGAICIHSTSAIGIRNCGC